MKPFLESFDAERWNFTFMDEDDTTQPVLKVGLVAVFYLVDAYLPPRRQGLADALETYFHEYGRHLNWGFVMAPDESLVEQACTRPAIDQCKDMIRNSAINDSLSFRWSSAAGFSHASDYLFTVYSPAAWFERTHRDMTCVRIYLPVEALSGGGREQFEQMIRTLCQLLRPLHGAAGLGVQSCYEWEHYQPVEYEVAWAYRGVDICGPFAPPSGRDGYRSLNWYTYIAHHWLRKLGTQDELREKLDDDSIAVLPYEWGSILRAGDWPELGKASTDPQPPRYVKVNQLLRPLRVADIGSLHYGSVAGEVRFNPRTSNLWLRRFDRPEDLLTPTVPLA